jgi:broad specificity phosphatase PhoE
MPFHLVQEQKKSNPLGPPNGETYADFEERVRKGLIEASNSYNLPLIVCHGGVVRAIYGKYKRVLPRVENATLYKLEGQFPEGLIESYSLTKYVIENNEVTIHLIQSGLSTDSLSY